VLPNRRLLFSDLVEGVAYKEVKDETILTRKLQESLEDYNAISQTPMHLVLFMSAIEHVLRIGVSGRWPGRCSVIVLTVAARAGRIIRQPLGNALLVGVGGSGRQSATRLATHLAEFVCLSCYHGWMGADSFSFQF
jgi:dynein heavy chain